MRSVTGSPIPPEATRTQPEGRSLPSTIHPATCVGNGTARPAMVTPRGSGWAPARATSCPYGTSAACSPGRARSRTLPSRTAGLPSTLFSEWRMRRCGPSLPPSAIGPRTSRSSWPHQDPRQPVPAALSRCARRGPRQERDQPLRLHRAFCLRGDLSGRRHLFKGRARTKETDLPNRCNAAGAQVLWNRMSRT